MVEGFDEDSHERFEGRGRGLVVLEGLNRRRGTACAILRRRASSSGKDIDIQPLITITGQHINHQ